MAITLWGRLSSVNVQKVVWLLGELGLHYEHVPLGGKFGGLDDPAYGALNPNGRVPTLRDGDTVIWESHSIVRYLAATHGSGTWWPLDPAERAGSDKWADWTAASFQSAWLGVFEAVVRMPKAQQEPEKIAQAVARANRFYRMLDAELATKPFLGGARPTYADIAVGASMYRWMTMEIGRETLPNLGAWYARLGDREPFRTAVCLSYAEMIGVPVPPGM